MPINVSCHDLQEKNFAIIELNRLAVTSNYWGKSLKYLIQRQQADLALTLAKFCEALPAA